MRGRASRFLDFDPKFGGASVGTLLAIVLQDLAKRAGMELGPQEALAYGGLIIAFCTWMTPRRRENNE